MGLCEGEVVCRKCVMKVSIGGGFGAMYALLCMVGWMEDFNYALYPEEGDPTQIHTLAPCKQLKIPDHQLPSPIPL